ncbi:MAG: Pyridoxine 5'-phosphate synthase [Syntrophorhabdus sp. PtaU1.Bin002]|nr:MAG: Pyridoxine 5'-phosphate synthase [Syntrophorhabdus sp. PtaB.Bin006]OPY71973.1 MAG: Pyridoxine 5'-phosphate synthase [Syntrophorhabdus sp. PtaU1.Bin002]
MRILMVNIDHVATLRRARGVDYPEPVYAAGIAEMAGASGIIVHLREDRRHIKDRDVRLLREVVKTKLNLEMAATDEMVRIALDIRPDMVTLVPEKREELTTEGGLDVAALSDKLAKAVESLRSKDIVVSLFIDPKESQIMASREVHANMVEIHTGAYSNALSLKAREEELKKIARSAERAKEVELAVNAGHGLDYHNVREVAAIPEIDELSIGYAIIARAVFTGLDRAVRDMIALIR